jgi:membrane associated rhomboid family serine protease
VSNAIKMMSRDSTGGPMMTRWSLAPPATLALFLATIATYLAQVLAGDDVVVRAVGLIPARVSQPAALADFGDGRALPAWLTFVTYMFPHGGWWHVAMNMAGLWCFGRIAEPLMGSRRFLFSYLASGVLTGLVIVLLGPHWTKPAAGASGAISGVLGAFLALRLPPWPARDRRSLAVPAVESACALGVVSWLLLRSSLGVPDRMSALMWHLIPFLAGWVCVRAGRRLAPRVDAHRG